MGTNDYELAIELYKELGPSIDPRSKSNLGNALNASAWSYATFPDELSAPGERPRAVEFAKEACLLNPIWEFLDTLATAHASNYDFENAKEIQNRAIEELEQAHERKPIDGIEELRIELKDRLKLFEDGKPFFIEPASDEKSESENDSASESENDSAQTPHRPSLSLLTLQATA